MKNNYPIVLTEREQDQFYVEAIEKVISQILPPDFFNGEDPLLKLQQQLPLVSWTPLQDPPFVMHFFLCCRSRENAFPFFHHMITRWLIPEKRLNAHIQFAADFCLDGFGSDKYIAGQIAVKIGPQQDIKMISKNLFALERELRVGLGSSYHANRILEIKGLSCDEKICSLQENIMFLIRRRPDNFDYDILSEMPQFLVFCSDEFKASRTARHMCRIVCSHYLIRKALRLSLEVYPERRYISVKLIRTSLNGAKEVLGIAIGISFIRENEHFDEKHIANGIKAILPDIELIENSYFINKTRSGVSTIYLEIEKTNGKKISLEEERKLKRELPAELKGRIVLTLNPLFMPPNEEEIIRQILVLSHELKLVRDLPQVMIDFSQQTEESLEFLLIILRVVYPGVPSFSFLFKSKKDIQYIHDRTKVVGFIRKKYKKEATVLRLKIPKNPFLRKDHSVDLYKARQQVVKELASHIGEFRDYNGGIIAKETELFENLRKKHGLEQPTLLENFFYSLQPSASRSLVSEEALGKLLLMLFESEADRSLDDEKYSVQIEEDAKYGYFLLYAKEASFKEILEGYVRHFDGSIAHFFLTDTSSPCFGALIKKEKGKNFKFLIEKAMTEWSESHFLLRH